MTNLLYICDYNMDRSRSAEVMMQARIKQYGIAGLIVSSAGLHEAKEYPPLGMTDEMRDTLSKMGYEPTAHTPRIVTLGQLKSQEQDIVLCFTKRQLEEALHRVPELEDRVYMLSEYATGKRKEIPAPNKRIKRIPAILKPFAYARRYVDYGNEKGVMKVHRKIAGEIERYVDLALQRMASEGKISSEREFNV